MKHYIFKATGIDTSRHNKKRTEYRHEVLQSPDEAIFPATCLLRLLISAGWEDIQVEVREVTETILITTLKEEQHDT